MSNFNEHAATWAEDTQAVRGGLDRSNFQETSEAIFLNSGFVYESAEHAEQSFTGEVDRFVYSRYGNPSVATFQERLRLLEGKEACFATASGMSAVFTALGALLGAGDRVVASRSLFGSCFVILNELLPRWGVETVFVDGPDLDQWRSALSVPTTAVFFESPSNPMQEIVDIAAVCELAHAAGAKVVADNVFATPLLQRCGDFGADIVVYSGTKHIDGQGRVLGGAILGTKEFIDGPVKNLMRHTGPALSAFNAWVLTKGLETMGLRVNASCASALALGEYLEAAPQISWVKYPLLPSHPQYELATKQMKAGGTVLTFELAQPASGTRKDAAFKLLNALQIVDISNNLGDTKSLITHPATTTHRAMGPEGRAAIGLSDGVLRLSVGLEDLGDLKKDLEQALAAI
ncbi:O-succinylhomoserine sulfhydrylase [Arthrobacter livingstonensis]|uniref:O-succinylhomoserine sulfhydrylase n=1 Tax=Arthrobacter livingstonensis TaxID=670078 RepID=A0A2V5L5U4_9MICC|nr:O-succinylhomoserine sulfhydrylase [Arthrobacter livingstonensis]PYI65554.1 O-succinylhomoserine sulfhydrylase [Arthrobacter livingstonensis]